jgi:hypothetical protein
MSIQSIMLVWALIGLAATLTLIFLNRRVATARWLVLVGIVMLVLEEPLLTWFWGLSTPDMDEDGMATLVTSSARAHVLDSTIFGTAFFVLCGWIATTAFRRGERWAVRVLTAGWVLVLVTMAATSVTVYSRGLFGPGYGWEQLGVGLLAWGAGLWLGRSVRSGQ